MWKEAFVVEIISSISFGKTQKTSIILISIMDVRAKIWTR